MPAFPTLLGYTLGIVVFVSVVAALVSQPGAELIALAAGFGLVVLTALVRRGAFVSLNARLAAHFVHAACRRRDAWPGCVFRRARGGAAASG